MKINLIRLSNSLDPKAPYLKDSENFINDLNNELFDYDIELVNNEKDTQFSIVFIETGGAEQKFLKIYKDLKEPIVLLSDSKNNSLPACFEIKTFLEQKGLKHTILFGDEKDIAGTIEKLSKVITAKAKVKGSKLGVIGKPSDWLIASKVNYQEVYKKFGVKLIDISIDELKEEIDKHQMEKVRHLAVLKSKWKNEDVLNGALNMYSALKRIVKKYNLSGFTLRCFDLIESYKNTACLAFSLLNEEGIVATCEGDVPTLLTMHMVKLACGLPSFQANPSKIDLRNDEGIFSHCTLPLNMCKSYELLTHFESDLGIGVKGTLENKQVTILKIAPDLKNILFLQGNIIENTSFSNYCRTQIKIKFDEGESFELIRIPFGNHVVIVYGNIIGEVLPFLHLFNIISDDLEN